MQAYKNSLISNILSTINSMILYYTCSSNPNAYTKIRSLYVHPCIEHLSCIILLSSWCWFQRLQSYNKCILLGSLERRFEFKEEHNCKPFSWFLENIYPEKFVLDAPEQVYAYGRLKNPHNNVCLDNLQNDNKDR